MPSRMIRLSSLACLGLLLAVPALAQQAEDQPEELEGVGITEHLDAQLPLDLQFKDENGRVVTLAEYVKGDKPVILSLIYFNCPMLCSLVLNGMVDALAELDWQPGQQFELVTVSFNPLESPELAKLKKQNYIKDYGIPAAASGWHFLTGKEASIKQLTETVGFGYKWNDARKEYAHSAAIFVLTPEGKVSRYLYGVAFEPQTVKLALLEASQGKIGTTVDRVIMYCYQYDAASGSYAPVAMRIMKLGGVLVIFVLALVLLPLWLRELQHKKKVIAEGTGR